MQRPKSDVGTLFKDNYWRHYDELPKDIYTIRIYCDTAQETGKHNDYTVFQCWGRGKQGIYLIDQVRGKWEAPQLESSLVEFYNKHKPTHLKPIGASRVLVEAKSSGSSLIQTIRQEYIMPIKGIPRHRDKVLRAKDVIGHLSSGNVYLPRNATWLNDYKEEFREFNVLMSHKHDDQIDPTLDAIEDLLVNENILYTNENLDNE